MKDLVTKLIKQRNVGYLTCLSGPDDYILAKLSVFCVFNFMDRTGQYPTTLAEQALFIKDNFLSGNPEQAK